MKTVQQNWNKGINKRTGDRRGDSTRFYDLQNARLQKRGNTLEGSRISGFTALPNTRTVANSGVLSSTMFRNYFVVLRNNPTTSSATLTITDVNTGDDVNLSFVVDKMDAGKLLVVEDTIYVAPYNKQVNFIDGQWVLNDYISTTPNITVEGVVGGTLDQSENYWYRVRYVYRDGHKTKTSYPAHVRTTNSQRSVRINVRPQEDLDNQPIRMEIFRKRGSEAFFLIDTTTDNEYVDTGRPNLHELDEENYVWPEQSNTQELVRDRMVRANIQHKSSENTSQMDAEPYNPPQPIKYFYEDFDSGTHQVDNNDNWIDPNSGNPIAGGNVSVREGLNFYGKGAQIKYLAFDSSGTYPGSQRLEHPYQYFRIPENDEYELSVDWYFENVFTFNTIGQDADELKSRMVEYDGLSQQQAQDRIDSWHSFQPMYKDTGFPFVTGKMHGLVSDYAGTPPAGGQPVMPGEWSVRCIWIKDANSHPEMEGNFHKAGLDPDMGPTLGLYIYDQDRPFVDGSWGFGEQVPMQNFALERLRWYTIKLYVKVDDPGQRNGIADLRVYDKRTGELLGSVRRDDLNLRGNVSNNVGLVHRLFFSTFMGGGDMRWSPIINPDWANLPDIGVNNGVYLRNDNYTVTREMTEPPQVSDNILPYNSKVEVFNQIRRDDGSDTFYKLQDTFETGTEDRQLSVRQTNRYEPNDEFRESAAYARYTPFPSNDAIKFNSLEIYNANVPSTGTNDKPESEQDRPLNPHVFLGWRSILVNEGSQHRSMIYESEWDSGPTENLDRAFGIDIGGDVPITNTKVIEVATSAGSIGQGLTYTHNVPRNTGGFYQLAFFDALREGIRQGKVKLRLTGVHPTVPSLSSVRPDTDFIGTEVQVVGLKDQSEDADGVRVINGFEVPSRNNKLHLILERGTVFDDFDNPNANTQGVRLNFSEEVPDLTHRFEFELIGLREIDKQTHYERGGVYNGNEYTYYDRDYHLQLTDYTDYQSDSAVLVHKFDNNHTGQWITTDRTGWSKQVDNKFEYLAFNDWNVNVSIVVEDDLYELRLNEPNQLIWSDPHLLGTNASKIRTFPYTNQKYISQEYGPIIDIQYIGGVLLVFCERGVNRINVGEVLTQQIGGETYVDSSRLLNNDFWVLKNLPNIQRRSIKQYENVLFFCDGVDVWRYADGFENITNGRVEFNGEIMSSGMDPKNKEYRITDTQRTWAYSIELDEWMGPYTYTEHTSSSYGDRMFSFTNRVVEHNIGNFFLNEPYDTIFQSVANDSDDPSTVKLYRKFYIETNNDNDDIYFEYGKDENINTTIELKSKPRKNGLWHVGVNNKNKNGRYLTWRLFTRAQNFILSSVSFVLAPRRRR